MSKKEKARIAKVRAKAAKLELGGDYEDAAFLAGDTALHASLKTDRLRLLELRDRWSRIEPDYDADPESWARWASAYDNAAEMCQDEKLFENDSLAFWEAAHGTLACLEENLTN